MKDLEHTNADTCPFWVCVQCEWEASNLSWCSICFRMENNSECQHDKQYLTKGGGK